MKNVCMTKVNVLKMFVQLKGLLKNFFICLIISNYKSRIIASFLYVKYPHLNLNPKMSLQLLINLINVIVN